MTQPIGKTYTEVFGEQGELLGFERYDGETGVLVEFIPFVPTTIEDPDFGESGA